MDKKGDVSPVTGVRDAGFESDGLSTPTRYDDDAKMSREEGAGKLTLRAKILAVGITLVRAHPQSLQKLLTNHWLRLPGWLPFRV